MRSEAYRLSGFTLVISALGFLLRWLQDMRIQNGVTGLEVGSPVSLLVGLVIVLTAGILLVFVLHLRQFDAPSKPEEALAGQTPFYGVVNMVPALVLAAAGVLRLVHPGDVLWPGLHKVCGVATLVGAFGSAVVGVNIAKPEGASARRKGAFMMMAFAMLWLVTGYRDAATDPVAWRYGVEIIAQCAGLLGIFYASGYFFNAPHPWWAVFMCNFGAFLCIMCAIDQNSLAQSATYAGVGMQLLIWAFVVVEDLKTKPLTPETPAAGE